MQRVWPDIQEPKPLANFDGYLVTTPFSSNSLSKLKYFIPIPETFYSADRENPEPQKRFGTVSIRLLFKLVNRNLLAVTADTLKTHGTVNQSKEGIVASTADICARMNLRAALTNQNITGRDKLTVLRLTPRRFDSESRPFFVEPTPFL